MVREFDYRQEMDEDGGLEPDHLPKPPPYRKGARLTEARVHQVLAMDECGYRVWAIARAVGTSTHNVYAILRGKTWVEFQKRLHYHLSRGWQPGNAVGGSPNPLPK